MAGRVLRRLAAAFAVAAAAGTAAVGCARSFESAPLEAPAAPRPAPSAIDFSLFLIGDAGAPDPDGDPVLISLERDVAAAPERRAILYLGDNIYPRGLPDTGQFTLPLRPEAERRLQAQIDVGIRTRTKTFFIPGNHDWAYMAPSGWDAIRRQEAYIREHGQGYAEMYPKGGCPGPVAVDLGRRLRLIMTDTQWWLHDYAKPEADSLCRYSTQAAVINAMNRQMLRGEAQGREIVVAGHHPLATGGQHGGTMSLLDHVFPLRTIAEWLYLPLPIVGSYYVLNRQQGASNQDIAGPKNQQFRRAFEVVFERRKPLLYAAGHDHDLQVMRGRTARYLVVSGAGIYGHVSDVAFRSNHYYAASKSGYMRLDMLQDGRARLSVITVDERGIGTEEFAMMLR